MALKIVLVAPMPSASENTTTAVNAGLLRSVRMANRKSLSDLSAIGPGLLESLPLGGRNPNPPPPGSRALRKRADSASTASPYHARRLSGVSSPRRSRRVHSS